MPINTNGGILIDSPTGTQSDFDFQKQLALLKQLQAQADTETANAAAAKTKARLLDPVQAAQAADEVARFQGRKDVQLPNLTSPAPFTPSNFQPVASHGGALPTIPARNIQRMALGPPTLPPMQNTQFGQSQPPPRAITRIGTSDTTMNAKGAAEDLADPNHAAELAQATERANLDPAVVAAKVKADAGADKLVKVEHKDPVSGRTVIEWLPQSQVRGQTFDKGTNATTENRLASAEAVNQTGNDMIAKLSDPTYAKQVGVAMGRFNNLRDFVGDPSPEFAELKGTIESYALANMGVHGMRSAQGAQQIAKLMDQKHTPESLIATIRGLSQFSNHFMQNEGRPAVPATAPRTGNIKSITPVP